MGFCVSFGRAFFDPCHRVDSVSLRIPGMALDGFPNILEGSKTGITS
jgi:hypothetical protein